MEQTQQVKSLKYAYILESWQYAFPTTPHSPSHLLSVESFLVQFKQIYEHFGNAVKEDESVDVYKYATS